MANWHALEEKEVFERIKSSEKGLSDSEARSRLGIYGKNEIINFHKINAAKIFLRQFASALVFILILSSFVSGFLGRWVDCFVILAVVFLNAIFGFMQEYKAEKAIEKLKSFLVPKARVMRGGKVIEIDSNFLVPGDILVFDEGDKIMADARIISSNSLQIDESSLTGESVSVEKLSKILNAETSLADRVNMVYQGTKVVSGSGKAIVVLTGMNTEYGKIANLVQRVETQKDPFRKKMDVFSKNVAIFTFILLGVVFLIGVLSGFSKFEIFLTSLSLVISVIPEGLPVVITLTLALATQKMLSVNTLIRKLPAAETLGRATVICTDKTGTMTEGNMQVKRIFVNDKDVTQFPKCKESELLFKIGILCNNARIEEENTENEYVIGDPTEKALILSAKKYGLKKEQETIENIRIKEFPFTSTRKIMSIVRRNQKGELISYVKGAPEVLIRKCNAQLINGKIVELDQNKRDFLFRAYEKLASRGMRILGFAYKNIFGNLNPERVESNLIFVGFQAMIDPPRPEVKEAVVQCQKSGIDVKMITGDSLLTAIEIGKEIGLNGKAITSSDLKKIPFQRLKEEIKNISIFARVSPEDKLRIVQALKEDEEVVAMTGDGVNDAPSLKMADIGIAVNRGTDVAKDSSDMILLDNNFSSIVLAVKEGRRVYDNIKKFIQFLLASNFSEVFIVLGVILIFNNPQLLPLLPLQVLWINLITDSFPALALSQEKAEKNIMDRKPVKNGIMEDIAWFVVLSGILIFIADLIVFIDYMENIVMARTMVVTTAIVLQMFIVFNCKSEGNVFKSPFNKYLFLGVIVSILLHLFVLYTPLNSLFGFVMLGKIEWIKIIVISVIGFLIMEVAKQIKLRIRKEI